MSGSDEISVVEVYEIASEIGAECEKLIDLYGCNVVSPLVKKCIYALEKLEQLASNYERESFEREKLNEKIAKLEDEKVERIEHRRKFEKELASEIAAVEETWQCEVKDLVSVINRLQNENQRLLEQTKGKSSNDASYSDATKFNDGMIENFEDKISKLRNEIKDKNSVIQEKQETIDQLNGDVERHSTQINELKKRTNLLQNQVKVLCEERTDFLVKIQDQNREISHFKKSFDDIDKFDKDKNDESSSVMYTEAQLKDYIAEQTRIANELRDKIHSLEKELKKQKSATTTVTQPKEDSDEEAPVQGPLPEEWYADYDDDDWKSAISQSGIRKFFRRLFTEGENGGFQKRSLSSLTKIVLPGAGPHTEIPI